MGYDLEKHKLDGVTYRILDADEFGMQTLLEVFEEHRSPVPNPFTSHIEVAEKDGKIIGLAVLQPQYHAEPIWVHKDYRDTILHRNLVKALLNPFRNFRGLRIFVFSPDSKIAKLAARFGFKQQPYEVFMKEF